jgi:uncharacterized protein
VQFLRLISSTKWKRQANGWWTVPIELLVIQPTPFCNIDCSYCYLPTRADRSRMSPPVMEAVFRNVFASGLIGTDLKIAWHAGEPLVLPPSYYTAAFELVESLRPPNVSVVHQFQTNATLIDDDWCRLFTRHRVRIGISVDGPAHLHDAQRRTRTGGGTHAQAMRGMRHLRDHGIPFDVITVLTRDALGRPDELFDFYRAHAIERVGFNIEEIEGSNRRSSLESSSAEAEYRRFLHRFWHLVEDSGSALRVREFDRIYELVLAPPGAVVDNIQVEPLKLVSIDCTGRWSTFSPELLGFSHPDHGDFLFGQAGTAESPAFQRTQALESVASEIRTGVEACGASCPYFALCGGGAPANKLFENGSFNSTETLFCRLSIKSLFDVVADEIESLPAARLVALLQ